MSTELDITRNVRKSNILNEFRNSNIAMAEYRLFCVYLAHFNMNDEGNNAVTFKLSDYARIVGLDRPRKGDLDEQAKNIVSRTAQINDYKTGGFTVYPIFDHFKLHKENEEWLVEIECHRALAPLIREQSGRFIRYKLYNTIFLKSFNQQRIYELLKQYEKIGDRVIELADLREFLGIQKNEYPVWGVFARDVLKVAQKAIKECTDIAFEYEPIKKNRRVVAVKFTIEKNDGYKDLLKLDGLLPENEIEVEYDGDEIDVSAEDMDPDQVSMFDVDVMWQDNKDIPERLMSSLKFIVEVIPEDVHCYEVEKVKAIYSILAEFIPFEIHLNDRDVWMVDELSAFNNRIWLPDKKAKASKSVFGYYKTCLEYALIDKYRKQS